MSLVKIWDKEIKGKLWTVGDIHGCHTLLMNTLNQKGFDFENDFLVAVGDLVDRGPQNLECIELLSQPWFTSIRGNHEDLCIGGLQDDIYKNCHLSNGGEWFYELNKITMRDIANKFSQLPVVLEVNYRGKKYGFVHGHIEENNWNDFKESFHKPIIGYRDPLHHAMWGRDRLDPDATQYTHVSGVDAVFMGHSVVNQVCKRDNCYYIDVGSCFYGRLAVLDLSEI